MFIVFLSRIACLYSSCVKESAKLINIILSVSIIHMTQRRHELHHKKFYTAHQTDIEYACMSVGEYGIGTTQDVTTPLLLQLYWMETIKGEPPFTMHKMS